MAPAVRFCHARRVENNTSGHELGHGFFYSKRISTNGETLIQPSCELFMASRTRNESGGIFRRLLGLHCASSAKRGVRSAGVR